MMLPREIDGVAVAPVRTSSHRSRSRLESLVGHAVPSFYRDFGKAWLYLVPCDLIERASQIKGVTVPKAWADDNAWHRPLSMS